MIDCMKWLKSATGGGWALAIQKWIRFWSFIDKVEIMPFDKKATYIKDMSQIAEYFHFQNQVMKIVDCYSFLNF